METGESAALLHKVNSTGPALTPGSGIPFPLQVTRHTRDAKSSEHFKQSVTQFDKHYSSYKWTDLIRNCVLMQGASSIIGKRTLSCTLLSTDSKATELPSCFRSGPDRHLDTD